LQAFEVAVELESLKPDHWWKVIAIAGGLIAAAAVPVQFTSAFLIGLGLLLFGAGEWVNHARRTQIKGAPGVGTYKVTGNPWKPTVTGILLDVLGVGLFGFGLFRLLVPLAP
jgi:hypothetical protein